jgi:hypothetical protein
MNERIPTVPSGMPGATCQHCDRPVRWGRTEQGFAGFVHVDSGLATCGEDN